MTDVDTVAVLGAGDMGHGIAELAALHGYQVRLRDVDDSVVDEGLDQIAWSLDKLADEGRIDEATADQALDRLTGTTSLEDALAEVDLVVEAVPEELSLKQEVFAEAEELAPGDAVFATNTSALRPTEIGADLTDPSRVVGMHFFNPVLLMDLVEVIPAEHATPAAVETVEDVAERLGKTTVTLRKDTPGFVTSRLVGAFVRTAIRAWEADLASKEQIDAPSSTRPASPWGPSNWPTPPAR